MKIAVIGMGLRYPGSNSINEYFENILSGRRAFRQVPKERWSMEDYYNEDTKHPDTTYCRKAAFIENFAIDRNHYRIPKQTYEATDPAQWMALKVAEEALQDASIDPSVNKNTGVIIGNTLTGEVSRAMILRYRWPYAKRIFEELLVNLNVDEGTLESIIDRVEKRFKAPFPVINEDNLAGALSNTIAGRICNYFDFKGGGFSTDGACSSSLLAINQACIGLLNYNCDIALAGGVDISLDPFEIVGFSKVGALSAEDIRVYDENSSGFLPGEGCGIVVLQRYEDAIAQNKKIYAVINGIGISSDGKGGITAPTVDGQMIAIRNAYQSADYDFGSVELIEGHGTGTPLGDKVELTTFIKAKNEFSSETPAICGVGSIKSNIGHTKAAAGVAGFIKSVMSVCYGIMPPTQGIITPNRLFKSSESLYPLLTGKKWRWDGSERRAAVSSAGFGGINTHITISSVEPGQSKMKKSERSKYYKLLASNQMSELICLGADSTDDLVRQLTEIYGVAKKISDAELVDLSKHSINSIQSYAIRFSTVVRSPDELVTNLELILERLSRTNGDSEIDFVDTENCIYLRQKFRRNRICFLFPGQGSQSTNMGQTARARHASNQEVWDVADRLYKQRHKNSISEELAFDEDAASVREAQDKKRDICKTFLNQPAITTTSIAVNNYLTNIGVRPEILIGHSLGELTALHCAGATDLEHILTLVMERGVAMSNAETDEGAMLSLVADATTTNVLIERVQKLGGNELVISNYNSPEQTIVSGNISVIDKLHALATSLNISSERLVVSSAFHSPLMKKSGQDFGKFLKSQKFSKPRLPILSTVNGQYITGSGDLDKYLEQQITLPVRFEDAIRTALSDGIDTFVEVGPGRVLASLTKQIIDDSDISIFSTDIGSRGQYACDQNNLLAFMFSCGEPLRLNCIFEGRAVRPLKLPYSKEFIASPCEKEVDPLDFSGLTLNWNDDSQTAKSDDVVPKNQDESLRAEGLEIESEGQSIDDVYKIVKSTISKLFGYPDNMLNESSRLQDDLGLDSLKTSEIGYEIMAAVGVKSDIGALPNSTLKELTLFIYELIGAKDPIDDRSDTQDISDMVAPLGVFENAFFEVKNTLESQSKMEGLTVIFCENFDLSSSEQEEVSKILVLGQVFVTDSIENMPPGDISNVIYMLPPTLADSEFESKSAVERYQNFKNLSTRITASAQDENKSFLFIGNDKYRTCYRMIGEHGPISSTGSGFIKTLHLEHPTLTTRCIDVIGKMSNVEIISKSVLSTRIDSTHSDYVIIDGDRRLRKELVPVRIAGLDECGLAGGDGGTILVSGGAKGITSECILELCRSKKGTYVLLGSSQERNSDEIRETLAKLSELHVKVQYVQCDISDEVTTSDVVEQVVNQHGPIREIIHAAGINSNFRIGSDSDDELKILGVKVDGLRNLIRAVDSEELNSLTVFSSIIANSGMMGNSTYAFANEWMNHFLEDFSSKNPSITCRSFGFSVWEGRGMGERLQSVGHLERLGISPIPLEGGRELFSDLMKRNWSQTNYVVAAKTGSLDTIRFHSKEIKPNRFTEKLIYSQPGLASVAEVDLSLSRDLYLIDHSFDGTHLFPAVFGIEAMVENVVHCLSQVSEVLPETIELKKLRFQKAIVVPRSGLSIRIYVAITECAETKTLVAEARIRSSQDLYKDDCFTGTVVLTSSVSPPASSLEVSDLDFVDLVPEDDLYGKILFQGPIFQNIAGYKRLSSQFCEVVIENRQSGSYLKVAKLNPIFGQPHIRDCYLHAVQACVPECKILPISIDSIKRYKTPKPAGSSSTLIGREIHKDGSDYIYDLFVMNEDDLVIECILGYRCRVVSEDVDPHYVTKVVKARNYSEKVEAPTLAAELDNP